MKPPALRKELFRDINFEQIDFNKNILSIIERVFNFGNIEEFKAIVTYYGVGKIKDSAKKAEYFDPKTLEFVISYFNLNPEEIQCFVKKQFRQPHWQEGSLK